MAESQREQAQRLYLESGKTKTLQSIADEVGVPVSTIKTWKQRDGWDKKDASKVKPKVSPKVSKKDASKSPEDETKPRPYESENKREKGGQLGNRNAVGHKGSTPVGNRRALKTGEYERIMYAALSPEEIELAHVVREMDKYDHLTEQLVSLTLREKWMQERIRAERAKLPRRDASSEEPSDPGMIPLSMTSSTSQVEGFSVTRTKGNALLFLNQLEDALTRVQQRKQVAIDALHKYTVDDRRYMGADEDDEVLDDGFMDALAASGKEVFVDGMDEPEDIDVQVSDVFTEADEGT